MNILEPFVTDGKQKDRGYPGFIDLPVPDDQDTGDKSVGPEPVGEVISDPGGKGRPCPVERNAQQQGCEDIAGDVGPFSKFH